MTGQPVVCVVDGDVGFRASLAWRLRARGFSVRIYASAAEVLLDSERQPGCFILDFHLPELSGLVLQDALSKWLEPPPIVFLCEQVGVIDAVRAMRGGALDILLKPAADDVLFEALDRALALDIDAREQRRQSRLQRSRFESLSTRERAVFAHVLRGCINRDIARHLHIAERTVKAYRARVMQVMEAPTLPDLVRIGGQLGLIVGSEPPADWLNPDVRYFPGARFFQTKA